MSKQHTYTATWSEDDQVFVSRVAEFPSLAAHGDTEEEAIAELKSVVAEVVLDLAKDKDK